MAVIWPVGLGYCVTERYIGVLGATSMVGGSLLPLLVRADVEVTAFSREPQDSATEPDLEGKVTWRQAGQSFDDTSQFKKDNSNQHEIKSWICLLPVWVLPNYFDWMESLGAKRIVVLSSTSRFTKADSKDTSETAIVKMLADGEENSIQWAKEREMEWIILRPTLIYGKGRDENISVIARFIRRFGFFPLFGEGQGYRQPIHVDDVAMACYQVLNQESASNQAYNISGNEKLTYREMVNRIFIALGKKPRIISLPLPVLRLSLFAMKMIPRYRHLTTAMVTRINQDMVFDHDAATRDFGFFPRSFELKISDIPGRNI